MADMDQLANIKPTGFQQIKLFFNSRKCGKTFTRFEYLNHFKNTDLKVTYLDSIRCYLVNAGYLKTVKAGLYEKTKILSKDLTYNKLQDEAYPHSIDKRKQTRMLGAKYRNQYR